MYLSKPCPRPTCGQMTLNQPEPHGLKLLCKCDSCGRYARYIIRPHVDGSKGYELAIEGGDAPQTVVKSFRVPVSQADSFVSKAKKWLYLHSEGKE